MNQTLAFETCGESQNTSIAARANPGSGRSRRSQRNALPNRKSLHTLCGVVFDESRGPPFFGQVRDVMTHMPINDILNQLAAIETRALAGEFLAPMMRGGVVRLRIAGVICRFKVKPDDFEGWGVFRPTSPTTAALVRPARLAERRRYLDLLPCLRIIICGRESDCWLAMPAHRGDGRFRIEGMLAVRLVEEVQLFDVVNGRFDGTQCWYDAPDPRSDPGAAAYLRESLSQMVKPERLSRTGLTTEECEAYTFNYVPRVEAERALLRDRVEERLRAAVAHAGAGFKGYTESGDFYRVTFEVDGHRHVSVVARHDLSVQVAGICLSGGDRQFDLQSLVGVIREAQVDGQVVRTGVHV
jgi:hypothetical protein